MDHCAETSNDFSCQGKRFPLRFVINSSKLIAGFYFMIVNIKFKRFFCLNIPSIKKITSEDNITMLFQNKLRKDNGSEYQAFSNTYSRLFAGGQRLGRFFWVRKAYSYFCKLQQKIKTPDLKHLELMTSSLVTAKISISQMIEEVRRDGVAFGFSLDKESIHKIHGFATQSKCIEPGYPSSFLVSDLGEKGELSTGYIPLRALVKNPLECLIVKELTSDQILLGLAQEYLGYFPKRISCHLSWSLATALHIDQVEKRYPPANFHYDIAGYNFATAYFYITPVLDMKSGPHEMFMGSHQKKNLKMLITSARRPVDQLYAYYGRDKLMAILGDSGFGFFQDPSCFHRVRPPVKMHRLLLQIRYS